MPIQEAPGTHLSSYVRLFVELHRLVAKGAGDSDEADELRDQLDRPWYKLSDVEMRMTDLLAVDLYDFDNGRHENVLDERLVIDLHLFEIAGLAEAPEAKGVRDELDRRLAGLDAVQRERHRGLLVDLHSIGVSRDAVPLHSKQAAHDFEAAIKRREWDVALTILRGHESEIPPAEVAAMRGVCWARLGNHEIASLFFGEAARQNPANIELESCYLRSLIRCGQLDDARRKARFIVSKETDSYRLLLAADILFDCLMGSGHAATRDEFEEIVNLVRRAAVDSTAISGNSNLRQLMCSAYLGAAISCERLGDLRRCEELYRTAHLFYEADSSPKQRASRSNQKWWGGSAIASAGQQERVALRDAQFPIAPSLSTN